MSLMHTCIKLKAQRTNLCSLSIQVPKVRLGCTNPLPTAFVIVLSVCNGVFGCLWPISSNAILTYTASHAMTYNALKGSPQSFLQTAKGDIVNMRKFMGDLAQQLGIDA